MAAFNYFDKYTENLAKGVYNFDTDTLSIYLTNTAPNAATHSVKADLAEIATGNGYAGPQDTQNTVSRTGALTSVVGTDIVVTAAGGAVGPFRYVVLMDDTPAGDPLIGWWDYGSSITLQAAQTFTTDFGANMFTIDT